MVGVFKNDGSIDIEALQEGFHEVALAPKEPGDSLTVQLFGADQMLARVESGQYNYFFMDSYFTASGATFNTDQPGTGVSAFIDKYLTEGVGMSYLEAYNAAVEANDTEKLESDFYLLSKIYEVLSTIEDGSIDADALEAMLDDNRLTEIFGEENTAAKEAFVAALANLTIEENDVISGEDRISEVTRLVALAAIYEQPEGSSISFELVSKDQIVEQIQEAVLMAAGGSNANIDYDAMAYAFMQGDFDEMIVSIDGKDYNLMEAVMTKNSARGTYNILNSNDLLTDAVSPEIQNGLPTSEEPGKGINNALNIR